MPSPVTAPPSVIVFSCGTTIGVSPCGRVAATRSSYVHMPWTSAVRRGRVDADHAGELRTRPGPGARPPSAAGTGSNCASPAGRARPRGCADTTPATALRPDHARASPPDPMSKAPIQSTTTSGVWHGCSKLSGRPSRFVGMADVVKAWLPWEDPDTFLGGVPAGFDVDFYDGGERPASLDRGGVLRARIHGRLPRWSRSSARCRALKVVQLQTAGFEHVLPHLAEGVTLCNARGVHDASTAELAVGLILASYRRLPRAVRDQEQQVWPRVVRRGRRLARGSHGADPRVRVDRGGAGAAAERVRVRGDPGRAAGAGRRPSDHRAAGVAAAGGRRRTADAGDRRRRAGWWTRSSWPG